MAASIFFAVFLGAFLSVFSAEIELAHVCIMNDDLADCGYTVKGVYGSSAVDRTTTRIQFDRLTDSVLNLYNLPEVVNIFIESDYFDNKRQACAHVIKNARPVTVKLGDKTQVLCPTDNVIEETTTTPDETGSQSPQSSKTPEEDRQTLSFKTKLAETSTEADTTVEDRTPSTSQDINAYIIISSSLSAFVILIIIVTVICYICCKCKRRRQQRLSRMELGVRFGGLPRHSVSEEETVFDGSKLD